MNAAKSAITNQEDLNDELQKELRRFLIPKLRSASYRWKYRSDAMKKARKSRGIYGCAICDCDCKNGEFVMDHTHPVVSFEGWDGKDWTTYITRMFVYTTGWQALCKPCHTMKSETETQIRKMHREKKKAEKKA